MMAEKYGLSKDELDEYSYNSHQRAIAATQAGKFKDEIVPLQITRADGSTDTHHVDEGIRFDVTLSGMEAEQARELVEAAHHVCPYSNATRDNIEVDIRVNGQPL